MRSSKYSFASARVSHVSRRLLTAFDIITRAFLRSSTCSSQLAWVISGGSIKMRDLKFATGSSPGVTASNLGQHGQCDEKVVCVFSIIAR